MNPAFLLAQQRESIVAMSPRTRPHLPQLKLNDPAVRAMNDFLSDPPLTVVEDIALEAVLDGMFRLGVRAMLVVRDRTVVGLITAEDARGSQLPRQHRGARGDGSFPRVADVMTASFDVPAIDWQTLQESRISDLIEIFEGMRVGHLVVLQSESANLSTVRGLIHRDRLERQLGSFSWARLGMG